MLSYTINSGASGTATVSAYLTDSLGAESSVQTFQISVTPVGETLPPVNSIPFAPQTVLENSAVTPNSLTFSSANGNQISVSAADAGANPVTVSLTVTGGSVNLTSGTSGLTGSGNNSASLSYTGSIANLNAALATAVFTPTSGINGSGAGQITMSSSYTDSFGTKTSTDSITINVTPVNQPPTYTPGGDVGTSTPQYASGTYSAQWATNITPGPANQSSESVQFVVSNNDNAIFSVQPSISPTGVLSFTPTPGVGGSATVTVQLQNNGGTANGGVNITSPQTFLIQLTPVDLAPVVTVPGGQRLVENTPLVFSSGEFNAISVADPDGYSSTEQVSLTASNGTLTLNPGSGVSITAGSGTNATAVTFQGTLTQLNAALSGLTFTPTSGFTGTASVTVAIDDLSTLYGGPITTTGSVNINVVAAPTLEISELMLNPPGFDDPNQYLEIRGPSAAENGGVPYTIPANTFLVSLSGNQQVQTIGNTLTPYPAGTVYDTFALGGVTLGSNGYLVILQNGNSYNDFPDDGGLGLVDPSAAVEDNGVDANGNPIPYAGLGFGNNAVAPGSSPVQHSALFRTNDIDLFKPSATYMLVQSPTAADDPLPGDELDQAANQTPTACWEPGSATPTPGDAKYDTWNVMDSVGITQPTVQAPGDVSYGYVNFVDDTGTTNYATPNSTAVAVPFTADYVGACRHGCGTFRGLGSQ